MLLKRDNQRSTECKHIYDLNDHKSLIILTEKDREIRSVGLMNMKKPSYESFAVNSLCYLENIAIDDGELLNVDALMALAKREDTNA